MQSVCRKTLLPWEPLNKGFYVTWGTVTTTHRESVSRRITSVRLTVCSYT